MTARDLYQALRTAKLSNTADQTSSFARPKIEWISRLAENKFQNTPNDVRHDPLGMMTGPERVVSALYFACAVVGRYAKDGRVFVARLEPAAPKLNEIASIFFKWGGQPGDFQREGYEFADVPVEVYREVYSSSAEIAGELVRRMIYTLRQRLPLSAGAADLISEVLSGKLLMPKPSNKTSHRDTLIAMLAWSVWQNARICRTVARTRLAGEGRPICAYTIVAAALNAHGIPVNPEVARNATEKMSETKALELQKIAELRPKDLPHPGNSIVEQLMAALADDPIATKMEEAIRYFDVP